MTDRESRAFVALLVVATLLIPAPPVRACGPFSPVAIFIHSRHPDVPFEQFAGGQLGVLQPTYARSYLAVAYRHMVGTGFNPAEQEALVGLWEERLGMGRRWRWGGTSSVAAAGWVKARNKIPGIPKMDAPESTNWPFAQMSSRDKDAYVGNYYFGYENCLEDAFRTATRTLNARARKFGLDSPPLRTWVLAQDEVFRNCQRDGQIHLPPAPEPGSPELIRSDRAYQVASAYFYAAKFDAAKEKFEQIARDESSPWNTTAELVAARCLIRKATLINAHGADAVVLRDAEVKLSQILSNRKRAALHPAARRLLSFIRARLYPRDQVLHLAGAVLLKGTGETLKQDLWDYTVLLDGFLEEFDYHGDDDSRAKAVHEREALPVVEDLRRRNELTDWIITFQMAGSDSLAHSLERWQKTGSTPWLVASIAKLPAGHPRMSELLAAADGIPAASPAYATVVFHSLRLMTASGRTEVVRTRLDEFLGQESAILPTSALNLFLALRMKLAGDLDDLLRFAPRRPAVITTDEEGTELPDEFFAESQSRVTKSSSPPEAMLGPDAAIILNEKVPLRLLVEAARNKNLPARVHRNLVLAAWVRAILLENHEAMRELRLVVEEVEPALKAHLQSYLSAKDDESRRFAGAFAILKFPGLRPYVDSGLGRTTPLARIDNYRRNWWCSFEEPPEWPFQGQNPEMGNPLQAIYPGGRVDLPSFLSDAQRSAVADEWKRLVALDLPPDLLGAIVLKWAKKHPEDPRVPEALHLTVRATRYGCDSPATSKYSREAFQLLHRRYPKSEWAKKTPYHF